jgi:NTP pyrophosphatase (non-canonical NTP hydrolase)
MTLAEYQEFCTTTAIYPQTQIDGQNTMVPVYPAMLLASEAGEILGKLQKCIRDKQGRVDQLDLEGIMYESGDLLWALSALCTDLGINLDDVVAWNVRKLSDRKARNRIQGSGDNR